MSLPWPLCSLIAGAVGTGALSLSYVIEHRLQPGAKGPVDYDDSLVPGQIVATIMDLRHVTARDEKELGLALRWGYGSVFGLWHGLLRRRVSEPWATVAFGMTLTSATLTLFPLLGRTPPPWRWPRDFLAVSLTTHAVYAVTVGLVDEVLSSPPRSEERLQQLGRLPG
jgi:hypothetical protein